MTPEQWALGGGIALIVLLLIGGNAGTAKEKIQSWITGIKNGDISAVIADAIANSKIVQKTESAKAKAKNIVAYAKYKVDREDILAIVDPDKRDETAKALDTVIANIASSKAGQTTPVA